MNIVPACRISVRRRVCDRLHRDPEGVSRIYAIPDDVDIHVVPGSGGGNPSLSPDGKGCVFVDGGIESSIDGPATAIGRSSDSRGIAWSDDGALIFPPQTSGPRADVSRRR